MNDLFFEVFVAINSLAKGYMLLSSSLLLRLISRDFNNMTISSMLFKDIDFDVFMTSLAFFCSGATLYLMSLDNRKREWILAMFTLNRSLGTLL